jgi:hypothetical protein
MLQMQADLEQLVQDDIPRREDRLARVAALKATLARADVSEAEKFRQLLQAYQMKPNTAAGWTIIPPSWCWMAHRAGSMCWLSGRVSLLAMTADRSQAWRWSAEHKQWQAAGRPVALPIAEALEMAADKKVPQLLNVPFPSAVVRRPSHERHHEVVTLPSPSLWAPQPPWRKPGSSRNRPVSRRLSRIWRLSPGS